MKKAIIYVRVSTDEQAEKGYSLTHQEDRLRLYCQQQDIEVVGFYREDHSAKTFNRPAFNELLAFLKKNRRSANVLLFLKWDRFSRNAGDAYGMINQLTKLGVEPQAMEQPLDLSVPENKIMLAFYLAAPEVENDRRSLNTIGQYHSINEFTRDGNNKILSKTFQYLDSTGHKAEDFLIDKWVYTYTNGLLKQKKKLGDKLTIQPDNKSSFESYEYDLNGRVIKETSNAYYEGSAAFYYRTNVKYYENAKLSVAITRDKKRLFSTVKTVYNSNQRPVTVTFIDGRNSKTSEEKTFTYSTTGQLLKLEVRNSGLGTECPDGGNFSDTYIYSSLNLIEEIEHNYKKTVCSLRFVYK